MRRKTKVIYVPYVPENIRLYIYCDRKGQRRDIKVCALKCKRKCKHYKEVIRDEQ